MSTTLYWYPPQEGHALCYTLKLAIREAYSDYGEITLNDRDVQFLRGLSIGSNNEDVKRECEILINAIDKFGEITLQEKC